MALHIGQLIEKHPYYTAGAVFIGGAVLIYIYYSGGGSTTSNVSSDYQTAVQAQVQLAQIEAQYGAQTNVAQAQQSAAADQVQGAVSIAGLEYGAQEQEATLAEALGLSSNAAQEAIQLAGIQTQGSVDINQANNQTYQLAANDLTTDYLATSQAAVEDYQTEATAVTNDAFINALVALGGKAA